MNNISEMPANLFFSREAAEKALTERSGRQNEDWIDRC